MKMNSVCLEMLTDRGYKKEEEYLEDEATEPAFPVFIKPNEKKCIVFENKTKLTIQILKKHLTFSQQHEIYHIIILFNENITPPAKKVIEIAFDFTIELFLLDEMVFNITKHYLVPRHIKLPDSDAKIIRDKYGASLPIILKSDAISKWFAFAPADIIKIIRTDGTVLYRRCV